MLKLMIPLMCCLGAIACKNNLPAETEGSQGDATPETSAAIQGVNISGGSDYGPYTLFTASSFKATTRSQKLKALQYYEVPEPVETAEDEFHMPDVINSLFPLGWSEEGHFAYATYAVGYHGAHTVNYMLRDMGTGDTLWRKGFAYAMVKDTSELYSEIGADTVILINGPETAEELFQYTWLLNEKEVLPQLEEVGIQFDPSVDYREQNQYGESKFEVKQIPQEDDSFTEFTLNSNKFDPKVIYSDYFGYQPEIAGVIKSPFSETIVVVCRQKQTLFEMENEIVPILTGYKME